MSRILTNRQVCLSRGLRNESPESGTIHRRLLTAWSAAGVSGPLIINAILDSQGKEPGALVASDYRSPILIMVAILAVGFVCNLLIKPVDERFHEKGVVVDAADSSDRTPVDSAADSDSTPN